MCIALARGVQNQMRHDDDALMSMEVVGELSADEKVGLHALRARYDVEGWTYWNDVPGRELNQEFMTAARRMDIDVVGKMEVWRNVPREQCVAETGRRPIGTRWVDANNGHDASPKVMIRKVTHELKRINGFKLFATVPPTDYINCFPSCPASGQDQAQQFSVMFVYAKNAYFYAPSMRMACVDIPKEDWENGDGNRCALSLRSLCGTRGAALNWTMAYGAVWPTCGSCKARRVRARVGTLSGTSRLQCTAMFVLHRGFVGAFAVVGWGTADGVQYQTGDPRSSQTCVTQPPF